MTKALAHPVTNGIARTTDAANERLRAAAEHYNLVSPASSLASLPDGCEMALSLVSVDATPASGEVYDVGGGKLGLSKVVLDRISAAAGVSWDALQSRRIDDGANPHYCHFRAVGTYKHFDGTPMQVIGEKEMDLREGSPQVEALYARFRAAKDRGARAKDPSGQIREMRLHILAHAETKARLRAIRSLGLKASYTQAELSRPFVVAHIMFTGHTDDPELKRIAYQMRMASALGGVAALYGSPPPQQTVQAVPVRVALQQPERTETQAPALGQPEVSPSPALPAAPKPAPAPAVPEPPPSQPEPENDVEDLDDAPESGPVVAFGKLKGTPIRELSDRQIAWYIAAYQRSLDDPEKARWRAQNADILAEYEHELSARSGAAPSPRQQSLHSPTGAYEPDEFDADDERY